MNSKEIVKKRLSEIKSESENQKILYERLNDISYKLNQNLDIVRCHLKDSRNVEFLMEIVDTRINEIVVKNRLYDIEYR